MTSPHIVAGVMSGTSVDGLDIAICAFDLAGGIWSFNILAATTIHYETQWQERLLNAHKLSGPELIELDNEFGRFTGAQVKRFCNEQNLNPSLLSSHGHTVFHQPGKHLTLQIGSGSEIAAVSGIDTACDFRSTDIALGGQGAPLVPIGDSLLFDGHRFCLNLGGFANVSFEQNNERIAFDICPVNIALNYLSGLKGKSFDEGGALAMSGEVNSELLQRLNQLEFYNLKYPKSLGREWYENNFLPIISQDSISVEDRLRTVVEHTGIQIANALFQAPGTTMLTTGGGALNSFLVEVIDENLSLHGIHIVVPDKKTVEFKEAVVFAFLGLLRSQNKINILKSVTGAEKDAVGGCIYKS